MYQTDRPLLRVSTHQRLHARAIANTDPWLAALTIPQTGVPVTLRARCPDHEWDGSAWLGSHQNLAPRPEDNTTTRAASRRVKRLIIADDQQSRIADALARARLRRDNQRRNIDTHGRRTMSTAAGLCWIQSRGYHLGTSGAITRHVSEAEMLDGRWTVASKTPAQRAHLTRL
jgi:hypothetical protein